MAVLDRFNGSGNIESWICRADQYFAYLGFSEKDWLHLPYFYLDGEALTWFTWLHRTEQFLDWKHFTTKLRLRFPQRSLAGLVVSLADPSLVCFATERSDTNIVVDAMEYNSKDASSNEVRVFDKCSHQNEVRASITQSTHISEDLVLESGAPIKGKVFDEILESNEPDLPFQFSSDNALLVSLAGHDQLAPSEIEPFTFSKSLFGESKQLLDAMTLISMMKSDLETENFGKAQVFVRSPQREHLSHYSTMFIDPLLAWSQSCTYLYYASEPIIRTITFSNSMDYWFDTGQGFKDDSGVLLFVKYDDLKQIDGFVPLITKTDLDVEGDEIAKFSPYLLDRPSMSLVHDGFRNLATHKSLTSRGVFSRCQASRGTQIYIVPLEHLDRDMSTRYIDASSVDSNPPTWIIELETFDDMYLAEFFMDPIIFEDQYFDNCIMEKEGAILSTRHFVKVLLEDVNGSTGGFNNQHILNLFSFVHCANFFLVTIRATAMALCVWDLGLNFVPL
ncbi:hypothetical protein A4A49_19350 [Nicotiana attenuata]|uniref:Uncharacterized protein n=1 Tax=Nicotiana attenuata TaxID=49451 RepID=A0A1J6IPI4_NICAT|nr:hypothetical protein A4A49_19350 [Nicotiana attenuata]